MNPPPHSRPPRSKLSSGIDTLVQAEKLMQIAILLPCSVFVGWAAGAWLDLKLGQEWIALVGMVFGGVSGLVYVVRLVVSAGARPKTGKGTKGPQA